MEDRDKSRTTPGISPLALALLDLGRAVYVKASRRSDPFAPSGSPAAAGTAVENGLKVLLKRSPDARVTAFLRVLQDGGLVATVRRTRGDDIDAACGQLAGEVQDRTNAKVRMTRAPVRLHRADSAAAQTIRAGRQETNA